MWQLLQPEGAPRFRLASDECSAPGKNVAGASRWQLVHAPSATASICWLAWFIGIGSN